MARRKVQLDTTIRIKPYVIIEEVIERGIRFGLRRAFKHDFKPSDDVIVDCITNEVMNALCDLIDFGD